MHDNSDGKDNLGQFGASAALGWSSSGPRSAPIVFELRVLADRPGFEVDRWVHSKESRNSQIESHSPMNPTKSMFPVLGAGFSTAWWGLVELLWIAVIGIIGSVLAVLFVALWCVLLVVGMLWCCGLALVAAGPLGACLSVVWWDEASGENDLRLAMEDEP